MQEAAYRALKGWQRYDNSRPFRAWFFAILRNAYLDSLDGVKPESVDAEDDDDPTFHHSLPDACASVDRALERAEAAASVRKALREMTTAHRAVLKLCDMGGLRYREIARTLRVPVGTVRSRIFRARRTMRVQWPELAIFAQQQRGELMNTHEPGMGGLSEGAEVISVYTRAQALEDGVLVDHDLAGRQALHPRVGAGLSRGVRACG